MKDYSVKLSSSFFFINLFGISVIYFILYLLKFNGIDHIHINYLLLYILSFSIFFLIGLVLREPDIITVSYKSIFLKSIYAYVPFSSYIFALSFLLKEGHYSRKFVLLFLFLYFLYIIAFYGIFRILDKKGFLNKKSNRSILIIGAGRVGKKLFQHIIKNFGISINIIGFLDDKVNNDSIKEFKILGKIKDLKQLLEIAIVDEMYITIPLVKESVIRQIIETAEHYGTKVRIIPNYFRLGDIKFSSHYLDDIPVIFVRDLPLDNFYHRLFKRFFDLIFSSTVITICLPLFVMVAILIKISSKGPVFFNPIRIGLNREKFKMYKFRSMSDQPKEISYKLSTINNDTRITPIGKFIRKFNIDELPQFFDVIKGNMSVVGPRPHRLHLDEEFTNEVYNYRIRQNVKPGITGWAQINGFRGPTDTADRKNGRVEHDLYYIENWSFWLDIKIIFLTLFGRKARHNVF